jgi:hypothetical protein
MKKEKKTFALALDCVRCGACHVIIMAQGMGFLDEKPLLKSVSPQLRRNAIFLLIIN